MRDLTAWAYEQVSKCALWSSLETSLQDLLVEIVEAAIELKLTDGTPCAECTELIERVLCEECWLKKHAETCHTCYDEIPIAKQRCHGCTENALRMALAAHEIDSKTIDAVIEELRP